MALTIARLYNFVSDKNNGIKILSARVDGEFDQQIASLNQKVLIKATSPSSPITGQTWVDVSTATPILKVYDGSTWQIVSGAGGFPRTFALMGA